MSIFLLIQLKTLLLNDHILINRHILFYFRAAIDLATRQAYALSAETAVLTSTCPIGGGKLSNAFAKELSARLLRELEEATCNPSPES